MLGVSKSKSEKFESKGICKILLIEDDFKTYRWDDLKWKKNLMI